MFLFLYLSKNLYLESGGWRACQGDESPNPAQMAALLYPLQMRFKYQSTDRAAEASELLALSHCNYGNADKETGKSSSIIMMTPSNPDPVVIGYFPCDEVGAVEGSSAQGGARLACMLTDTWPGLSTADIDSPLSGATQPDPEDPEEVWGFTFTAEKQ